MVLNYDSYHVNRLRKGQTYYIAWVDDGDGSTDYRGLATYTGNRERSTDYRDRHRDVMLYEMEIHEGAQAGNRYYFDDTAIYKKTFRDKA